VTIVTWLSLISPLPLGGDSGTWTALSYPFILSAHPSEIIPFGYPPLMFPVLGFFVLLGGPLIGPRIYLAVVGILLGTSTYVLGRSLFRHRVSALLAEALLFVTVPFDRLFFFGGYPTLLALVFANLSLAFGVRWVRGRRPAHLVIFWLATGATLLTHEFVGLALVVTLVIIGFFLLVKRQLPSTIIASPAGAVGVAIAGTGVGGYYLGTRLAHVPQNNYLASNALAHLRFPVSAVLYPLHIQALGGLIGYQSIKTANGSFAIAAGVAMFMFLGMLVMAVRWPKYLTPSAIFVLASILAILAMALGGWVLSIYTDYRRFAFSLYLPFILVGLLAYDTVFSWCAPPKSVPTLATPGSRPSAVPAGAPRSGSRVTLRPRRRPLLLPIVAMSGAVIVVLAGGVFAYPGLVSFRNQYTGNLHTWDYIDAMQAILQSNVPGAILSVSGGATEHWTFAMTDRNVYSPTVVSQFIFKSARVSNDQLAYFPFHYRTTISTGTDFVAVAGNTSVFFTGAPTYGSLRYGTPSSILAFAPDGYTATLANGTTVPAWTPGSPVPAITMTNGTSPSLTIHFVTASYDLNVTSQATPAGPVYLTIEANATGPWGLRDITADARAASANAPAHHVTVEANTFVWQPCLLSCSSVTTFGSATLPALVSRSLGGNASVALTMSSPNPAAGSRALTISVQLTSPSANNIGSPLPSVIQTPAVLANWGIRFVLLNNVTRPVEASESLYFIEEYDATILYKGGSWEVLLLPPVVP